MARIRFGKNVSSDTSPADAPAPQNTAGERALPGEGEEAAPAVLLVNSLLQRGMEEGASDIHLEPFQQYASIRIRIDGALVDCGQIDLQHHRSAVTRIKVLAQLDIAKHRIVQDGHFEANLKEGRINVRVSVMPTLYGEKVVLRILADNVEILNREQFGMSDAVYRRFVPLLRRRNGILYLTGPTGSGKSTTMYLALQRVAEGTVNVTTIEDPVERSLERINQVQVNPETGLTFSEGLRAVLRQDPDVIMVGETRDLETAKTSIHAAMTGHLVFSTLHTNGALESVARLEDMGIEPYDIASAVIGFVAQRLVRRVCPHCGREVAPTREEESRFGHGLGRVVRGTGCACCHGTGYLGRIAIHEMAVLDPALRKMILQRKSTDAMIDYACRQQGMRRLWDSAAELVRSGMTTPEEAETVCR